MGTTVPSRTEIVEVVAGLLEVPPSEVDPDTNLLEAGLGSLELMRLTTRWRRSGLSVSYREMTRQPTVSAWERHLRAAAENPDDGTADDGGAR